MRGAYGYPDRKIDEVIASAEAASSPGKSSPHTSEKTDTAIFASKAPGWMGWILVLGAFCCDGIECLRGSHT